jgi:hypothetical protein
MIVGTFTVRNYWGMLAPVLSRNPIFDDKMQLPHRRVGSGNPGVCRVLRVVAAHLAFIRACRFVIRCEATSLRSE